MLEIKAFDYKVFSIQQKVRRNELNTTVLAPTQSSLWPSVHIQNKKVLKKCFSQ